MADEDVEKMKQTATNLEDEARKVKDKAEEIQQQRSDDKSGAKGIPGLTV